VQLGFLEGISADHKYKEKLKLEGAQPRQRTVRLGKEIAGLNNDLPLNPTSSVFVRVDEQNVTLWRALITGELCASRTELFKFWLANVSHRQWLAYWSMLLGSPGLRSPFARI